MSPVWIRNDGGVGIALMRSRAILNVAVTSLFASLEKPMWLSLICKKLRSIGGNGDQALAICDSGLQANAEALLGQSRPVPAQAVPCTKPPRWIPSRWWS